MRVRQLTWAEIDRMVDGLATRLPPGSLCWGVPRGGSVVAALLRSRHGISITAAPSDATIAVDDLIDSGRTARMVKEKYNLDLEPLLVKDNTDWIVFPWEGTELAEDAENTVTRMLQQIGENPNRPELEDTPREVVQCWQGQFSGYSRTISDTLLTESRLHLHAHLEGWLVLCPGIPFLSFCERHLIPFFGSVAISYVPLNPEQEKGLSIGLPELVQVFSRRLQTPERLARQICDAVAAHTGGAAVRLEGKSLCPMAFGELDQPSEITAFTRSVEYAEKVGNTTDAARFQSNGNKRGADRNRQ